MALLDKVSRRERVLAVSTGLVLVLWLGSTVVVKPLMQRWAQLDSTIQEKQSTVYLYTEMLAMGESVDLEYGLYKTMMSDESSDEAVRNRLQEEIDRLAAKTRMSTPTIKEGVTEAFPFFKRYEVDTDVEGTIAGFASFLEQLQRSPQLLKVETMTINRKESGSTLTGQLKISRALVATGVEHPPATAEPEAATEAPSKSIFAGAIAALRSQNLLKNGNFEEWSTGWGGVPPDGWQMYRVKTERVNHPVAEGYAAARLVGEKKGAALWQTVDLKPATTYRLVLSAAALSGSPTFGVYDEREKRYYGDGPQKLTSRELKRHFFVFTTSGKQGDPEREARVIVVTFRAGGQTVVVDDVMLFEAEPGKDGAQTTS
jgi:hypothetical protein